MRGADETSGSLFSYVDLKARIPARHPLRTIRQVVNEALASLDGEFEALYQAAEKGKRAISVKETVPVSAPPPKRRGTRPTLGGRLGTPGLRRLMPAKPLQTLCNLPRRNAPFRG